MAINDKYLHICPFESPDLRMRLTAYFLPYIDAAAGTEKPARFQLFCPGDAACPL